MAIVRNRCWEREQVRLLHGEWVDNWGSDRTMNVIRAVGAGHGAMVSLVKTWIVAAALAGSAAVVVGPVHAETISLSEGYQRMLSSDLELRGLGISAEIADEIVRQARGQRLPRVSLSAKATNVRQVVISSDNTTFQRADSVFPKGSVTLTITQPLFDQVRWRAMPLAQAQKALSEARAEVVRNSVTRDYINAYMTLAAAQLRSDQAQALIVARNQLKASLQLQIDSGRGDPLAMTRVEGDIFAAEADFAEAEQSRFEAIYNLQRYVGPEVDAVRAAGGNLISGSARNLDSTFTEAAVVAASLDVQLARAEVAVAEREALSANANLKPVVNLTLRGNQEQTKGSLFGGGSDIATGEASIEFEWMIYEGGVRRARLREQQKEVELAQLRVTQAEGLAVRRLGALKEAIVRSAQREGGIAAQAASARQAYEEARLQEEAGKIGADVAMENQLRARVLELQQQEARLRTLQLEAELLGLFGALDTEEFSARLSG